MKCNFVVGQKVVCIKDGPWVFVGPDMDAPIKEPRKDDICEITGMGPIFWDYPENIYLSLRGYSHQYFWRRFRPLQYRGTETGMAILRKLLSPKNHEELENVC